MPNRSSRRPTVWLMMSSTRLRLVVERRHDRRDHRADFGQRGQRAQMADMQRRLAHRQHQAALLLEHDVGGARHQRRGHAGRDLAHGADRAGHDDHAHGRERARRDRCADVGGRMIDRGERADVLRLELGLVDQRHLGRLAHDQMGFDVGLLQHFQHPDAVDGAGRAGNADHEPARGFAWSFVDLSSMPRAIPTGRTLQMPKARCRAAPAGTGR